MRLPRILFAVVLLLGLVCRIEGADEEQRLQSVRKLYEQKEWEKVLREARGPADQSADFDYYAGMALSRLERWTEAREAFSIGARKMPRDARFLVERAGAEYKLGTFRAAKRDLRRSLRLNPDDRYAAEFLGTIYLLEGNLEASLKYWNVVAKPRLEAVEVQPAPKTDKQLLDRAVTFAPPGALDPESLLKTNALLENLEVFSQARVELSSTPGATEGDGYKATIRLNEQSRWGSSLLDGAISLLRGLPYQTVYPSYYGFRGAAVNFDSLVRWDQEKRRVAVSISFPLFRQPGKRVRLFFDQRNENWNLARTFSAGPAAITDLNMKRFAGGAQIHIVESGRWDLATGVEVVSREFRNLPAGLPQSTSSFFINGKTSDAWLAAHRSLIRVPERRFTVDGSAEIRAGRNYAQGLGAFSSFKGEIETRWLPKARGHDFEFISTIRGAETVGDVPIDELYQLGMDRDNDLWLRAHSGTIGGRKGAAPLGRRYLLLNSEIYKTAYDGAFLRVQLGPFLDTGAIADPTSLFGSRKWLVDVGIQARIRIFGSASVVLSYGRDLRNGTGLFYGTSMR